MRLITLVVPTNNKVKDFILQRTATFVSPGDYRSGRGIAVPGGPPETWYDKHTLGNVPRDFPSSGQSGDPSSAPSVTMSQIQQQHMTDEDIEYWEDAAFDPPYIVNGNESDMGQYSHHVREVKMNNLRKLIRKIVESAMTELEIEEDGEKTDEVSTLGGGAIAGYTTPLGTGGNQDDDRIEKMAKSFGGGKMKK